MINESTKRILSSFVIIPLILFFIIKGSILFNLFVLIFLIITAYEWLKLIKNLYLVITGIFFLIISSYTSILLRGSEKNELLLFLFVILICVASDVGGYIFGKSFKGPKLTKISPNKTYAGTIGSYFLSLLASYLFIYNYPILNQDVYLIVTIILISTVSQLGDLTISYFKRLYKKKNTGNLIPGHGGLLDRADGIIFAIPFAFIIFKVL